MCERSPFRRAACPSSPQTTPRRRYMARNFEGAIDALGEVQGMRPGLEVRGPPHGSSESFSPSSSQDGGVKILLRRAEKFLSEPPPEDWNGAETLVDKHF